MASVLQYFNHKKAKPPQDEADKKEPDTPVLSEETEKFLEEVTGATEERPELPPRRHTIITEDGQEIKGKDAQIALMNGANEIPLPTSPAEGEDSADETEDETSSEKPGTQKAEGESKKKKHKATSYWSYVPAVPWRSAKVGSIVCIVYLDADVLRRTKIRRKREMTSKPRLTLRRPAKRTRNLRKLRTKTAPRSPLSLTISISPQSTIAFSAYPRTLKNSSRSSTSSSRTSSTAHQRHTTTWNTF